MKILIPQRGGRNQRTNYESYTHKICTQCKKVKPVNEFYRCKSKTNMGWSYHSACKTCDNKFCQDYSKGSRAKRNARIKRYRKNNPEIMKALDRRRSLKRNYGLTIEQADMLFFRAGNKCEVCRKKSSRLCIDHCHKTKKVRGILCSSCNTFIGRLENYENFLPSLEKYLRERCLR